jgi:hypothetical protein
VDRRINGVEKEDKCFTKEVLKTTNNENLRQERKEKYFDGRREYEGRMQEAKLK